MRLGEGGGNWEEALVGSGLIWGDLWGGFFLEEGERTYRLCRMLRRFLEGEG